MPVTGGYRRFGFSGCLIALGVMAGGGCGSGGNAASSKTIYQGPQEVDQKKADLFDAMKGGAYGSAGRKSAPNVDPTKK